MKCEMCHTEIKPNDLVCVRCGLLVPNRPLPDDITASPAVQAVTPLKPALEDVPVTGTAFSLRDMFAAEALSGHLSNPSTTENPAFELDGLASACYQVADAMLRARKGGV